MQVTSTLKKTSTLILAIILLGVALAAYLYAHHTPLTKVKAAAQSASEEPVTDSTTATASETPADVTVNGQHIDVPANGSKALHLSTGEDVNVSSTQGGGSTTTTTSPNASVQVSTQTSNGSSSTTSTQVFSSSFNQSNNSSQDQVFSTSTNNVQVTH